MTTPNHFILVLDRTTGHLGIVQRNRLETLAPWPSVQREKTAMLCNVVSISDVETVRELEDFERAVKTGADSPEVIR